MKSVQSNLSQAGSRGRRISGVAVLLALAACLAGVALPLRRLSREEARCRDLVSAEQRLHELRLEWDSFEAGGGLEDLERLLQGALEELPGEVSRLDLTAALAGLTETQGFSLSSLFVGEFEWIEDLPLGGALQVSHVRLEGVGGPHALEELVELLEALGYPCAISSFSVQRLSDEPSAFELRGGLSLYRTTTQSSELSEAPAEEEGSR